MEDIAQTPLEEKHRRFNAWRNQNGVLAPKLEYPARFGHDGSLVGVGCIAPIEYREAFLFIPYKLLITVDAALKTPELAPVFEEEPMFWKGQDEYEQCILTLFLLWEFQKGESGFWWPYLDLLPDFEELPWELPGLQGDHLAHDARDFKKTYDDLRAKFQRVVDSNSHLFREHLLSEALFRKLYGSVVTRCFGYGVPFTCMVPMGDNMNHHDKLGCSYEVINPRMHLRPDKHDKS